MIRFPEFFRIFSEIHVFQSIFRDRMSVYYAVGLSRADSAAHFYGELRNVAEQVVLKLKRQTQERRAQERGRSSLRSMCGKLRSVAALFF